MLYALHSLDAGTCTYYTYNNSSFYILYCSSRPTATISDTSQVLTCCCCQHVIPLLLFLFCTAQKIYFLRTLSRPLLPFGTSLVQQLHCYNYTTIWGISYDVQQFLDHVWHHDGRGIAEAAYEYVMPVEREWVMSRKDILDGTHFELA